MIVEMIAREIGEGAGGEPHAVEPVLIETVRGGFHRQMGDAVAGQPIERSVQADRIGRGQRSIEAARRRDEAGRAEGGGGVAERRPDLAHEGRDRGLAAGAGHRDDGRRLAGIEPRRRLRERGADAGDADEGHARARARSARERRACNHGHGPGGDGVGGIGASVGLASRNREEDESRAHLSAVGGEPGNLAGADCGVRHIIRQEIAERDQCSVLPLAGILAAV